MASAFLSSFFLANFISSLCASALAGAAGAVTGAVGAGVAATGVFAGCANADTVARVAIRVTIDFMIFPLKVNVDSCVYTYITPLPTLSLTSSYPITKYSMQYISYQGIYDGTNFEYAGTPDQIGKSFNHGYAVLQNVWRIDGVIYLGVYQPRTVVSEKFIQGNRFFLNAMNQEMQTWLPTQPAKSYPNYFWFPNEQENTPVTTSGGQLITPGTVAINNTSIIFLPEIQDRGMYSTIKLRCYGICSNYASFSKRMRNEGIWY